MSGFSADWLALREPADAQARAADLAGRFARALPRKARIADLGAGAGSMGRWLAPFLPKDARLFSVDGDAALLVHSAPPRLRRSLGAAIPRADAYVSSALIDLVSVGWLRKLLRAARRRPVLMCLAVDGRHGARPAHPRDPAFFAAFARHQRRWKDLGAALGPDAPLALAREARRLGWTVHARRSDWVLPAGDLARATLEGIAHAAREVQPGLTAAWPVRRGLTVGHADVLLLPHRCRRTASRA